MTRPQAIAILRQRFPHADEIRFAGKCHACKRQTMYSYQLPGDGPRGNRGDESCGYFCCNCKWGNGGSRKSIDFDVVPGDRERDA